MGAALAVCLLFPVSSAFAQEAATVDMQGVSFMPTELHVAPGTPVTFTNSSPLGHTVTADDGSFDSGMVDSGGLWSMTFDSPGVYQYYCQPHGSAGLKGMSATIIVDDPEAVEQPMAAPAPAARPRDMNPTEYTPDH